MKKKAPFLFASLCLASLMTRSAQADPVFHLIPQNGTAFGNPGAMVSWGLTVLNPDHNFVLLTDSLLSAVPPLGTYTDLIATSPNVIAGPLPESSAVTVPQIGMFRILANAPGGTISGTLTVDYSLFSQDPNGPGFDPGSFLSNRSFSQPVTVNVAPEPGSLSLIAVSAMLLGFLLFRKRYR